MSKKHQFKEDKDENGEQLDPFFEMLQILDTENLLRFRKRLEKVGKRRMVEILTDEIKERDSREKAEAKEREKAIEEERKAAKKAKH